MKLRIAMFLIFSFFVFAQKTFAEEGFDYNFSFIDNPFAGQKIITETEYNKALSKYEKKKTKKGFWNWFFKHTLPKEEGPTTQYKEQYDAPKNKFLPKEIMSIKTSLTLAAEIYDSTGKILPPGYYQISVKNGVLELSQGSNVMGTLSAKPSKDNWEKNEIIYARIININDDFIKIIYSNLNECYSAVAQIKKY